MVPRNASWWRETGRLTLRYLAVGVSFAAAGLVYGLVSQRSGPNALYGLVCLGLGFFTAHLVWTRVARTRTKVCAEVTQDVPRTVGQAAFQVLGKSQRVVVAGAFACTVFVLDGQQATTFIEAYGENGGQATSVNRIFQPTK